jgi:hypothetical protein
VTNRGNAGETGKLFEVQDRAGGDGVARTAPG